MKKPDWFILIDQWVSEGMGEYGVTLPFLVGALAYKKRHSNLTRQEILNILDEIMNQPVEGYVTEVTWCPDIKAPVLNIKPINSLYRRIRSPIFVERPSEQGESLVFGTNLGILWKTKDPSVCLDHLADNATEPICNGKFSKRRKDGTMEFEYGDFSAHELDYIKRTIMSCQPDNEP